MIGSVHDHDSEARSARLVSHANEVAAGGAELIDAAEADTLPASFGVFKPVGYVLMGLPTQAQADALVAALHDAGWAGPAVRQFSPRQRVAEMQARLDNAGPLAGFGYEITLAATLPGPHGSGLPVDVGQGSMTTSWPRPLRKSPAPAAPRSQSITGCSRWKNRCHKDCWPATPAAARVAGGAIDQVHELGVWAEEGEVPDVS